MCYIPPSSELEHHFLSMSFDSSHGAKPSIDGATLVAACDHRVSAVFAPPISY